MRLFYAVEVPPLPPWDPEGSAPSAGADTAPTHLTVRFLGERPESILTDLVRAGQEAARPLRPFAIEMREVGAFPAAHAPRVVWIGIGQGSEELRGLERGLTEALRSLGIPPETRPFVPHVTWRRIRSSADRERARRWLDGRALPVARTGRVDALLLKESELGPNGARHRTLATFPLGREGAQA